MRDNHLKDLQDRVRKAENQVLALTAENNRLRDTAYRLQQIIIDGGLSVKQIVWAHQPEAR